MEDESYCAARGRGNPLRYSQLRKERSRATTLARRFENVRFWHKADLPMTLANVCFWGK